MQDQRAEEAGMREALPRCRYRIIELREDLKKGKKTICNVCKGKKKVFDRFEKTGKPIPNYYKHIYKICSQCNGSGILTTEQVKEQIREAQDTIAYIL